VWQPCELLYTCYLLTYLPRRLAGQHTAKRRRRCTRQSRSCLQLCQIFADFKFFFTHRLSNTPLLIWFSTTRPRLKYAATLPCNLSLMACFADINVSQGSVGTYARCGGIFSIHLTANLPGHLPVKTVFTARCYASAVLAMGLCLSVCPSVSVCLSQVGVLLKRQNVGSHKQHHTIPQ